MPVAAPPGGHSSDATTNCWFYFLRISYHLLRLLSVLSYFPSSFSSFILVTYDHYFVSALHPTPRSLRAWSIRIPLAYCLLYCVADVDLSFFPPLPSLSRFRCGHGLFYPLLFLWVICCLLGFGFCCDSFRIWYVYIIYSLISHFFKIFVWGIWFVSVIVCIIFCFYLFSSCGNLPLQS